MFTGQCNLNFSPAAIRGVQTRDETSKVLPKDFPCVDNATSKALNPSQNSNPAQ